MLKKGTVIDEKYRILEQVGRGGMSSVYLAINEKANKRWAIKEVRKNRNCNFDIVRKSLETETNLLKTLNHKNLPSIVDVIDKDDNFLVVMDYIEGVTLEKLVKDNGAQRQEDVVNWAIQLCDVLQYLHTRTPSIIYRDMKPSNIMLKNDGSVVLIDFGTAREYKTQAQSDTTYLGTRGYAAPEQSTGTGQSDARTDIYSIGATMYHLLTGHNPSEAPYEMYPITCWNTSLSKGLEAIITKCTKPNPNERFQSALELKEALEHYNETDTSKLKRYKRIVTVFTIDSALSFTCIGTSAGMEAEQMDLCSKILLGYGVVFFALAISMYYVFDIKRLTGILRGKDEIITPIAKKKIFRTDNSTSPLPQALAALLLCIFAVGFFPIKSLAAGMEIIINDIEDNPNDSKDIQIVEMISIDGNDDTDEESKIYVVKITIPTDSDSTSCEYYSINQKEDNIITIGENQIPQTAAIPDITKANDEHLAIILAAAMACVVIVLVSIMAKLYIAIKNEKNASL
jgi:serine/threonine protein kinase